MVIRTAAAAMLRFRTMLALVQPDEAWFWATHQGAEIDLLMRVDGRLPGVECKRSDAPRMTRSIRTAMEDLKLDAVAVAFPGDKRYPLADRVEAVPLADLAAGTPLYQ